MEIASLNGMSARHGAPRIRLRSAMVLIPNYDPWLVGLSVAIAVIASYVSFSVTGRLARSRGWTLRVWWLAGALAMGWGVWAMHFVGMLALHLGTPLGFDVVPTLLSMLPIIVGAGGAMGLLARAPAFRGRLPLAGTILGAGVGGMHYAGMAAMRMQPAIVWQPGRVVLSLLFAVLGATAALWVALHVAEASRPASRRMRQWGAALLMGAAVAGTHYLGMGAAGFAAGALCLSAGSVLQGGALAIGIAAAALLMLLGVLAAAWLHERVEAGVQHRDQALTRTREMLIERMYHDDLTGLPNRVLLLERLQRSLADAELQRRKTALLVLELKGFKMVNDWLGHEAGDQALRAIATSLRALAPEAGMVARLDGDEFAVVIDHVRDPGEVERLCRQVLAVMRQPVSAMGYPVSLQPSIGLAVSSPGGDDAETLLRNADAALQVARQQGDAGYRLFEKGMHRDARERLTLTLELREAIRTGVLQAYFQPTWDLRSGALVGAEALARWVHPQRGQISPTLFVPLAEADGLAGALGAAMLDQVLGQLRGWLAEGLDPGPVAINLSLYELRDASFIDGLRDKLEAYQVPADRLRFEITESVAMGDLQATLARLHAIVALGCGLLIDDFGTGYSSLSHLRHLPIEAIKIDQSFVRAALVNQADRDITEAIVALAKRLRLKIVAEGVETEAQARWLREIGCDVAQGFLYARPLPAAEYAERLRAARGTLGARARVPAPALQVVRAP